MTYNWPHAASFIALTHTPVKFNPYVADYQRNKTDLSQDEQDPHMRPVYKITTFTLLLVHYLVYK